MIVFANHHLPETSGRFFCVCRTAQISKLTTRIETYPLFIEKVVSSASNWLSFTFQVKKGDVFCWSQGATSSDPSTQYTIQISGSVYGTYANGASSVSVYNNAKAVAVYTAQADEVITINSYVNSSATFRNGAVTVKHAT